MSIYTNPRPHTRYAPWVQAPVGKSGLQACGVIKHGWEIPELNGGFHTKLFAG